MTKEEAIKDIQDNILPIVGGKSLAMAISALRQPEHCGDAVSRNAIVQKLNEMDRYVSTELRLCDTDKKFPQNEVFIVDDVYEEIVEQLPSVQPFHIITLDDVLKYIDYMPEDVWLEFTECLKCRGWELQWCGGDFA